MDRILYLSDSKLDSIVPRDRSWWRRLRARSVKAGVKPYVVSLETEFEVGRPDLIDTMTANLNKADDFGETAKWYEDPDLSAGELMQFEGRIGYQPVAIGPSAGAVLFCQLPAPGCRSVVLHGSAEHVLQLKREGKAPTPADLAPFSASDPSTAPDVVRAAVRAEDDSGLWNFWRSLGTEGARTSADMLSENLAELYETVVATDWFRNSAPYVGGFAFVSGVVPLADGTEIVLGSPLYVKMMRPE